MITPAYIRTMAEYNAEMNRRLYAAAGRLTDVERRMPRGAFWGSIHGTLTHILWGDRQWMSRFDAWPKPTTPIKESAGMIEDFAVLSAERERADRDISHWAGRQGRRCVACRGPHLVQRRRQPRGACAAKAVVDPLLQPPDPSSRAGPRDADRRRPGDRRHRPVPAGPRDRRPSTTWPLANTRRRLVHPEQACRGGDVRAARLLAAGFVVFERRPVGRRHRGLRPHQAGGRATRHAPIADELGHRRFIFAGRHRHSEDWLFTLADHGEASRSNRWPISVPPAYSAQFRMLPRFLPGIADRDVAPP